MAAARPTLIIATAAFLSDRIGRQRKGGLQRATVSGVKEYTKIETEESSACCVVGEEVDAR